MSRLLNALKKIENRGPVSAADEYQGYESNRPVWPAVELAAAESYDEEGEVEREGQGQLHAPNHEWPEADEAGELALPSAPAAQVDSDWDESLNQEAAQWPLAPVEWPATLERFESDDTFWS